MSVKTRYICDNCQEDFKVEHSGGKSPTFFNAVYEVPVTHFRVRDTRGDNYDFCSQVCLANMEF